MIFPACSTISSVRFHSESHSGTGRAFRIGRRPFRSRRQSMAHRSMRTWSAPIWLIVMATLLLFSPGLSAQDNATISGTVTDASGAVVPNADISLTEPGTGQIRVAKSNEAGLFRFANLGIGTYSLTATATGFQKFTRTGIVLNVAQTLGVDI